MSFNARFYFLLVNTSPKEKQHCLNYLVLEKSVIAREKVNIFSCLLNMVQFGLSIICGLPLFIEFYI